MSTRALASQDHVGSLLRWLTFRDRRDQPPAEASPPPRPTGSAPPTADLVREARRQLLEALSTFLLCNDLEVMPDNLLAGYDAYAGVNPRLKRNIEDLQQRGEKVTQDWLNEATCQGKDRDTDIERLMAKLEANLEVFSRSTRTAHSAASDYNTELEQHVADLEEAEATDKIIASLADLARAMLERSRKIESEMRRSEEEAKSLRQSLGKAKREAEIDFLTGLPNRRAFEALLAQHYGEARAEGEPLCIALCDIDNFKRVNDTHGHEAGDRVIRMIARSLAAMSDEQCHVARHGGEEFVMLFRGLPIEEARGRLDRAREELAARTFVNRKTDQPFGQITFSGGVVSVWSFPDARAALAAADAALYEAKESGRNQIVMA